MAKTRKRTVVYHDRSGTKKEPTAPKQSGWSKTVEVIGEVAKATGTAAVAAVIILGEASAKSEEQLRHQREDDERRERRKEILKLMEKVEDDKDVKGFTLLRPFWAQNALGLLEEALTEKDPDQADLLIVRAKRAIKSRSMF